MKSYLANLMLFTLVSTTSACRGDGPSYEWTSDEGDTSGNQNHLDPLDWDDPEGGNSPGAVFEPLEGECTGTFKWDTTVDDTHVITPQKGETEMTVSIRFDRASLKSGFIEEKTSGGVNMYFFKIASADVSLASADGVFVASGQINVSTFDLNSFDMHDEIPNLSLTVPLEEIDGTLKVPLAENESGSLRYRFTAGAPQCAGTVWLEIDKPIGNGGVSGYGGEVGSWTATDCDMGETEYDLNTPLTDNASDDETIGAIIEDDWSDVTLRGTWDDGQETELYIRAEPTQLNACKDDLSVTGRVPVRIAYGTADGRITDTETEGRIAITFRPLNSPEEVTETKLVLRHEMQCGSPSDIIPYTLRGCDTLERVTIELLIDNDSGRPEVVNDGLIVREYLRNGSGDPDTPDNVVTLDLN